jgi:hypothetical protein
VDKILLREAFTEEADRFRASYVVAKNKDGVEEEDQQVVFLFPVTEPE